MSKQYYLVMRLMTKLTLTTNQVVKMEGMYGVLPVFETMKQAKEASEKGKFEIILITLENLNKNLETI